MDLRTPGCAVHLAACRSLPPAFQDIFKLFCSSQTGTIGTVDMLSMKATLHNVGIQLSPQEMCEALQQADLDGGCPHPALLSSLISSPAEC